MIKKIIIEIDEINDLNFKYSKDITLSDLIKAGQAVLNKASEISFYDNVYTCLEKILSDNELEDDNFMKSVVILGEKVRNKKPNIAGNDFVGRLISILLSENYFDDATKATDFLTNLNEDDFLFRTDPCDKAD